MLRSYTLAALVLATYILAVFFLQPGVIIAMFLAAIIAVVSIHLISGLRAALISYIPITFLLWYIPLVYGEFDPIRVLNNYIGVTLNVAFLIYLNYKIAGYQSSANVKERRLQIISDSLTDVLITIDSNSTITFINPAVEKTFGYKDVELIGKPLVTLMPKKFRDAHLKAFHTYLATNKKTLDWKGIEVEGLRKDGTEFPMEISFGEFNDGKIRYFSAVIRDISIRKELDAKKHQLAAIVESSDDAIISKDLNGIITSWNKGAEKLFGYTSKEIIGQSVTKIFPKNRIIEESEVLRKITAGKQITHYETIRRRKDGSLFPASITVSSIKDAEGEIVGASKIVRDITQRRAQEQEVRNSQERYKAFIENSDDGICRFEFTEPIDTSLAVTKQIELFFEKGYIAEANEVTADIIGVGHIRSLLNTPIKHLEQKSQGDEKFLKLFIENGYTMNDFESTEQRGDKILYHSTSMKGIIEDGKWVRSWVVRRDITARREYQIEREKLLKVTEDAKRGLEIASAEKDRFLANLSHELRTPLVSILGYSAMLLDTPPDSENFKKMVSTINKSAKHQVQLIEDLLDLSRIISGKIELKKDFFNVAELAGDSVDTIRNLAAQKGLEIEESYENCRFYGDRKRLSQVFLNLLSNAVKFTEKGKICLTFRCTKDYLTIKITDTGIGIDPNKFHLLFQPFKQLDSSSTRAKTGLGLGLSIVKNIVDLHNGKVTVESKVGEGSEFTVFLPVLQAGIIDEADSIHKTPTSVVTFEGVKMLLVEDDPDSAEFVKYLYEQRKAKVDWADSAKGARELIEKNKYDLYLFDLSMPLEDGISLIKSVRAKGDKTKAVALTAFADTFYEKTALDSGFDMFLKKPSSLLEMLSVIKLIR